MASLIALAAEPHDGVDPRDVSISFALRLEQAALVGGVAFCGFPTLPSTIDKFGASTSNCGLPRERRVVTASDGSSMLSSATGFLDDRTTLTRQEITSHEGFHYHLTEPTHTDSLILRLSDFPALLREVWLDPKEAGVQHRSVLSIVIPRLYVFEYVEGTRYRPLAPVGMLGASLHKAHRVRATGSPATEYTLTAGSGEDRWYYPFTAASVLSATGMRSYGSVAGARKHRSVRECFVSSMLEPGESVTLVVEQAEDHARCIAGLRLLLPFVPKHKLSKSLDDIASVLEGILGSFPVDLGTIADMPREELEEYLRLALQLPSDIDFCEKVRVTAHELDPPEGVSPLSLSLDGKYATRLCKVEIDELGEQVLAFLLDGIRFTRASHSRYLALTFSNIDKTPGRIVSPLIRFIQSAHVSVHSRAAVTQTVRSLKLRMIGPRLAEDYASLGVRGLSLSIERLVSGQPQEVLFRARSLLDLVHDGSARLIANSRRRAVDEEYSEAIGGPDSNYEVRLADSWGWRRAATGSGVDIPADARWSGVTAPGQSFGSHSSEEIRSHTDVLSPQLPRAPGQGVVLGPQHEAHAWKASVVICNLAYKAYEIGDAVQGLLEALNDGQPIETEILNGDVYPIPSYDHPKLYGTNGDPFREAWRGIVSSEQNADRALRVGGMKTVTANPYGVTAQIKPLLQLLSDVGEGDMGGGTANLVDLAVPAIASLFPAGGLTNPTVWAILNSAGVSVSVSPMGIGLGLSASPGSLLLPSLSFNNSFGTQGSIAKQARVTGNSRSQHRNEDSQRVFSRVASSSSARWVRRKEDVARETDRVRGGEVLWQSHLSDILTATIPLNLVLPARASRQHYDGTDQSIRVRLHGVSQEIRVDVWFELSEEAIRDDF